MKISKKVEFPIGVKAIESSGAQGDGCGNKS